MPHRVANFFRSSNDNINSLKASVQRRKSPNPKTQPSRPREGTVRRVSYASSTDEDAEHRQPSSVRNNLSAPAVKMTEPPAKKDKDHHHHRLSFPGLHLGGSKAPKEQPQHPHASLDWRIESPPAMMHGDPDNSTGALVSGQMVLKAKDIPLEVESFTARLNIHVTQKKPFQGHCSDCANQKTELKSWTFLAEPTTLTPRTYFPMHLHLHLPPFLKRSSH